MSVLQVEGRGITQRLKVDDRRQRSCPARMPIGKAAISFTITLHPSALNTTFDPRGLARVTANEGELQHRHPIRRDSPLNSVVLSSPPSPSSGSYSDSPARPLHSTLHPYRGNINTSLTANVHTMIHYSGPSTRGTYCSTLALAKLSLPWNQSSGSAETKA